MTPPQSTIRHAGRFVTALAALAVAAVPFVGLGPAGARTVSQVACTITVQDDAYQTPVDTPLTVDSPGVVTNDTICGTDGLVISESSPSHGTLSDFDDSDGGFTYTPDPGFTGTDSFTYSLEDVEASPVATVTITVGAATTTTAVATSTTAPPTTAAAARAVQAAPAFTG